MEYLVTLLVLGITCANAEYYGKDLGKLSELHHGVRGRVYAVDSRTLFIKDFHYDGEGPAAFFYVGNTKAPSTEGAVRVRDERGSTGVLRRYRGKDITLTLPEGKSLSNLRWFSVYCDEYSVDFGNVKIPRNFDYPRPQKISALSGVHGVSSDAIVIVDAQTLLVPNFSYDGEAPDAKFWVGQGEKPSPAGVKIPDENGKVDPLRKYEKKTIVLTLPGDLTIFDIGHFGVWCEAFTVDFGHVRIPQLSNVPPSLKMLGVSPQKRNQELLSSASQTNADRPQSPSRGQSKFQSDLKPTTYRPHLARIGANFAELNNNNNFEAPFNVNDARYQFGQVIHSQLHRRADDFTPPRAQQLTQEDYKEKVAQDQYKQQAIQENLRQKELENIQYRQKQQEDQYRKEQIEQYKQIEQQRQKQIEELRLKLQQEQIKQSQLSSQQPKSSLEIVPSQEIYYQSQPLEQYQYQQQFIQQQPFAQQTYQPVYQNQFQQLPQQPQEYQRYQLRQYFPSNGLVQYVPQSQVGFGGPTQRTVDLDPERRSGFVVQRTDSI